MAAAGDPEEPPRPPPPLEPSGSEAPPDAPALAPVPVPPPPPAPAPAPAPAAPATEAMALVSAPAPAAVWTAVSPPAEANGSSDRKKKRKAEDGEGCRTCSCKKSRCLKLYCVCFASGSQCSELCGCDPCYNKPIHGVQQNTPPGLPLQVVRPAEAGQNSAEFARYQMDFFRRKCTCKKSGCLKKYCDCYQGGAGCSINCKCDDCKNPYGKRVGVILDGKSILAAPTPGPTPIERNGTEVISSDDDDDDEDDYYMNRPLSPIPPSPVSRESSFQQETLVGVEVHTVNGHLYPKPLTQVRPESWQLSRRPAEEARGEQWRYMRRPSEDGTSDAMEGHADPKFHHQRDNNNKQRESPADNRFSIPRCIEVMNGMADLSPVDKSLAPDVFLDPSNREIFLSLSVDIRTMWLKRKMRSLV
ncbi:hypothetical protein ACQJBY_047991 [Aegilops geniculata]